MDEDDIENAIDEYRKGVPVKSSADKYGVLKATLHEHNLTYVGGSKSTILSFNLLLRKSVEGYKLKYTENVTFNQEIKNSNILTA